MQFPSDPNAASHSDLRIFFFKLKRFETNDEGGDNIARGSRKDRDSYDFFDSSSAGFKILPDVTDLLCVGQSAQSELRFRFGIQFPHIIGVRWLNDRANAVEKPIKSRMQ